MSRGTVSQTSNGWRYTAVENGEPFYGTTDFVLTVSDGIQQSDPVRYTFITTASSESGEASGPSLPEVERLQDQFVEIRLRPNETSAPLFSFDGNQAIEVLTASGWNTVAGLQSDLEIGSGRLQIRRGQTTDIRFLATSVTTDDERIQLRATRLARRQPGLSTFRFRILLPLQAVAITQRKEGKP